MLLPGRDGAGAEGRGGRDEQRCGHWQKRQPDECESCHPSVDRSIDRSVEAYVFVCVCVTIGGVGSELGYRKSTYARIKNGVGHVGFKGVLIGSTPHLHRPRHLNTAASIRPRSMPPTNLGTNSSWKPETCAGTLSPPAQTRRRRIGLEPLLRQRLKVWWDAHSFEIFIVCLPQTRGIDSRAPLLILAGPEHAPGGRAI